MNHKTAFLPLVLFFFAQSAAAEEYQILGLELPRDRASMEVANRSDNDDCGEYKLEKVTLLPSAGTDATPGSLSILDPMKQSITMKALSVGEKGLVKVSLLNEEGKPADSVQVLLLKLNADKSDEELISRARTDSEGQAQFDKQVTPGEYQVALECGTPVAVWGPAGGALGAVGATALAVGLTTGGSGGGATLTRTDTPLPPAAQPPFQPPLQPSGQPGNPPVHAPNHPHQQTPSL